MYRFFPMNGLSHCFCLVVAVMGVSDIRAAAPMSMAMPTMSYEAAVPLTVGGTPIDFGYHAAVRAFDWDQDGDVDLLAATRDGRLWLYRNVGTPQAPKFEEKEAVVAGGRSRWGSSYSGMALANLVGNALPDLVVAHSASHISIHENIGRPGEPVFAEEAMNVDVQNDCHGRFDAADWDGDGLVDLVTGAHGGKVVWYRNEGTAEKAVFSGGESFFDISVAYNSMPRMMDFNQDGRPDLLLGVNWGTVSLYLNTAAPAKPALAGNQRFQWANGNELTIRELNGDDTTPDLADLDGDGVLDLISGGNNGKLFFMKGIGYSSRVATLQQLLGKHAEHLGAVLRDDAPVRGQMFGILVSLQADLENGLIPAAAREAIFQQLAPLAKENPSLLQRAKFDLSAGPHLPIFAGQYWVTLLELLPNTHVDRERVAEVLGFDGWYQRLLVDLGVLLIDNNSATTEHLVAMHRLMMAIPRSTWDVETITVAGWLGEAAKSQKIRSRTGVNIFETPLGHRENSFPKDSPRAGVTDVFLIVLAHELAHNMLDTVGRRTRPELFERKFEGLAQAAGPDVVFRSPASRGIDLAATRKRFQAVGAWDGTNGTWKEAWGSYFNGKDKFERAYTRGNVNFFLDAPQEAFATLANQYFADSQLMLEMCWTRWEAGYPSNINQFLLIADYLSEGTNQVSFYTLRPGGALTVEAATLERDGEKRITMVKFGKSVARFSYEKGALVTGFVMEK